MINDLIKIRVMDALKATTDLQINPLTGKRLEDDHFFFSVRLALDEWLSGKHPNYSRMVIINLLKYLELILKLSKKEIIVTNAKTC